MTHSHYIAGRWVEGQGSDCITVHDPALGVPFAEMMAAAAGLNLEQPELTRKAV